MNEDISLVPEYLAAVELNSTAKKNFPKLGMKAYLGISVVMAALAYWAGFHSSGVAILIGFYIYWSESKKARARIIGEYENMRNSWVEHGRELGQLDTICSDVFALKNV
ncbi:MAG: hypothetical protein GQ535_12510 [Rhodobacteraceae bacterium]|nr:hypothetical protein [Paracoccaceae bacterium]